MKKIFTLLVITSILTGVNAFADTISTTEIICTASEKGTITDGTEDREIMLIVQRSFPSNLKTLKIAINGVIKEDLSGDVEQSFIGALYSVEGAAELIIEKGGNGRHRGYLRLPDGTVVVNDLDCRIYSGLK